MATRRSEEELSGIIELTSEDIQAIFVWGMFYQQSNVNDISEQDVKILAEQSGISEHALRRAVMVLLSAGVLFDE